ncbi:hypothetical protein D3C80_2162900 [compost metagenome]
MCRYVLYHIDKLVRDMLIIVYNIVKLVLVTLVIGSTEHRHHFVAVIDNRNVDDIYRKAV